MAGIQELLALSVLAGELGLTQAAGAQGYPTKPGEYPRHIAVTNEERRSCIHYQ